MSTETLFWLVVPGLATGLGGVALLVVRRPSDRMLDALLGFTAGIMLAATAFSLLVPALDLGSVWGVLAGFSVGAIVLLALDYAIPHVHARFAEPGPALDARRRQALLLVSALTIHNVPEGLAVGVAFAAGGSELGIPIALAIGIQNIPEGFAAAAPRAAASPGWLHAWAQRPASSSRRPPSRLTPPSSMPGHSSRWASASRQARCSTSSRTN